MSGPAGSGTIRAGTAAATSPRPTIPAERYATRLRRAAELARAQGLAALLVGVGSDLRYLAGYEAMPLERLTMLVVPAQGRPTLVAPRLEATPARSCPAAASGAVGVVTWEETEDPIALVADLVGSAGPATAEPGSDGPLAMAVSDRLWAMFVLRLQAALPGLSCRLATNVLRELRIIKDAEEIELLRLAAQAADRVVLAIAGGRLVGRTEEDVGREVRDRLIAEGHQLADFAIVGSGPNSASPHHSVSPRVIQAGEPIVLDIGGALDGYNSDVTRTIWVTGGDSAQRPGEEYLRLYGVLEQAQGAARAAVRPGVPAEVIDATAREMIAAAGFGPRFIHRLGHGIGLEVHEEPYLVAGNAEPLREGMAFSVEPGIYFEGRWGARIEDIVVCGRDGPIALNEVPRGLLVADG